MEKFNTNTVIIGAGVVGLAIAREISQKNSDVVILEKEPKIGQITSSRNSGVIHAGIYYQPKSLKSKLCVEGNKLLYEYAKKFNVPHINTKKIIVANNDLQMHQVQQIKVQAETNGVENLEVIDEKQVNKLVCEWSATRFLYRMQDSPIELVYEDVVISFFVSISYSLKSEFSSKKWVSHFKCE